MEILSGNMFKRYYLSFVVSVSVLVMVGDNLAAQDSGDIAHSIVNSKEQAAIQKYYDDIDAALKHEDNIGAVKLYDDLIKKHPEYVKKDGLIVTLMYHRAVAHGYPRLSVERQKLFEEIWNNAEFKQYPRIYNIGRMVVLYAYRSNNYVIANKYANELLSLLEKNYDAIPYNVRVENGIDTAYKEGLVYSARSKGHLFDLEGAVAAYDKLLQLFPNSIFEEEAITEVEILCEKLNEQQSIYLEPIEQEGEKVLEGGIDKGASDKNINDNSLHTMENPIETPLLKEESVETRSSLRESQSFPWKYALIFCFVGLMLFLSIRFLRSSLKKSPGIWKEQ